jgi:hypothetical protein
MGVLEVKLDQPGVVEEGREVVLGVGVRAIPIRTSGGVR